MRVRATVYIPNWNGGSRLEAALVSLAEQTLVPRVVVVDNGSDDDSKTRVRERFPDVALVELAENVGFARALNAGVAAHPSELLLFLNNDVRCEPRFVEALVDASGANADMVAGVLLQRDQPDVIDSAGTMVDCTLAPFDYLHGEPVQAAATAPPPLGPTGGAALVRLEVFEAVGGFDERIFAYLEDVDLALRLRLRGARCVLAADARALHDHSATLGSGSPRKNWLMGWSRGYLVRRYRVLTDPRLTMRTLLTEAVISAGQAIVDRNLAGVRGRVAGWRAGAGLPPRHVPNTGIARLSMIGTLKQRLRRRVAHR